MNHKFFPGEMNSGRSFEGTEPTLSALKRLRRSEMIVSASEQSRRFVERIANQRKNRRLARGEVE